MKKTLVLLLVAPLGCILVDCGAGASCSPQPFVKGNRYIFITESAFDGNLGGISGANLKCQQAAEIAGLLGHYVAVLQGGTKINPGESPVINFTGGVVIPLESITELNNVMWSLSLESFVCQSNDINCTTALTNSQAYNVWTGITPNNIGGGWTNYESTPVKNSCDNWTSRDVSNSGVIGYMNWGWSQTLNAPSDTRGGDASPSIPSSWAVYSSQTCDTQYKLYCVTN